MDLLPAAMMWVATVGGMLLSAALSWFALIAVIRLVLGLHTPVTVALLLTRLSAATAERRPWEPVLRGLRPLLPWPWPWRLGQAADQLAAGVDPAAVLANSRLLPTPLRAQAAQALRQGPEVFRLWCTGLVEQPPMNPFVVRQVALIVAELSALLLVMHFLLRVVYPKWEMIALETGMRFTPSMHAASWVYRWEDPLLVVAVLLVVVVVGECAAWAWRRARRHQAARLLLAGTAAGLPEAALGSSAAPHPDPDFAQLAAAAGWSAATPAELARQLARADYRQRRRAAWLPALVSAVLPLLLAVPVGALVIGTMSLLVELIYRIESLPR